MEIKNRILKQELIAWKKAEWFQPKDFKHTSIPKLKKLQQSLKKNGVIAPFHVWEKAGKIFILDGHVRHTAMSGMRGVPEKISAVFLDIKDEEEAKKYVFLFNSHYAELSEAQVTEWLGKDIGDTMEDIEIPNFDLGDMLPDPVETDSEPEQYQRKPARRIVFFYTIKDYNRVSKMLEEYQARARVDHKREAFIHLINLMAKN